MLGGSCYSLMGGPDGLLFMRVNPVVSVLPPWCLLLLPVSCPVLVVLYSMLLRRCPYLSVVITANNPIALVRVVLLLPASDWVATSDDSRLVPKYSCGIDRCLYSLPIQNTIGIVCDGPCRLTRCSNLLVVIAIAVNCRVTVLILVSGVVPVGVVVLVVVLLVVLTVRLTVLNVLVTVRMALLL